MYTLQYSKFHVFAYLSFLDVRVQPWYNTPGTDRVKDLLNSGTLMGLGLTVRVHH